MQQQAKQILSRHDTEADYLLQLLALSAQTAFLTALTKQTQLRTARDLASEIEGNKHAWGQAKPANVPLSKSRFFALSKNAENQMGNLFAAHSSPDDLNWLDMPDRPLQTARPPANSLFDSPQTIQPQSYLSKRILKKYKERISQLPSAERESLIQTLDEAVSYRRKFGRAAALKFLKQKASLSSRTSFYFVMARRMLLSVRILLAAHFTLQPDKSALLERLAENPSLFIDATEQDLRHLAAHEPAVSYCRSLAHTLDLLASTPFSEQEINHIFPRQSAAARQQTYQLAR